MLTLSFGVGSYAQAQSTSMSDSNQNTSAISKELEQQRTSIVTLQKSNLLASEQLIKAARAESNSITVVLLGVGIGTVVYAITGNVKLASVIFGVSSIISFGNRVSAIHKFKKAGMELSQVGQIESIRVNPIQSPQSKPGKPIARVRQEPKKGNLPIDKYVTEYLYFNQLDSLYIYSHNSVLRGVYFGINGPFSFPEVENLMNKHSDFTYATLPSIEELQTILKSQTKLNKKLVRNRLTVWSSEVNDKGDRLCLNFHTGQVEEQNPTFSNYFVPIVITQTKLTTLK
jgi:hypothetical protein